MGLHGDMMARRVDSPQLQQDARSRVMKITLKARFKQDPSALQAFSQDAARVGAVFSRTLDA